MSRGDYLVIEGQTLFTLLNIVLIVRQAVMLSQASWPFLYERPVMAPVKAAYCYMFGFGKTKGHDEDFDYDSVVSKYEGEVAVGDYVAESLNRSEVNN